MDNPCYREALTMECQETCPVHVSVCWHVCILGYISPQHAVVAERERKAMVIRSAVLNAICDKLVGDCDLGEVSPGVRAMKMIQEIDLAGVIEGVL